MNKTGSVEDTGQKTVTAEPEKKGLKMVFALRHGEYNSSTMELNSLGVEQSNKIATKLRSLIPEGSKIAILSSPAKRAEQTAEVVGTCLGVKAQVCPILIEDEYGDGELKKQAMLDLVDGSEVIIAITHHVAPSGIIHAFAMEHLGKRVRCEEIRKGDGMMINLLKKEVLTSLI